MAAIRHLGPARASVLGGAIARTIGPALPLSAVAHRNLAHALPALDAAARRRIVRQVWDNLGRSVAEMAILDQIGPIAPGPGAAPGYWIERHPQAASVDFSRGAIYFAGHLANWEIMMALSRGVHDKFAMFYRAPANAGVDLAIRELRAAYGASGAQQFRKGAIGARQALDHLRQGGVLGLLADQKTNDGIPIPFFGRPAMTAPAVAALALKFRLPLIPAQAQRMGNARFRVILHRPLDLPDTGNRHADIATLTATVTAHIESWIRERPGDWLWLHRRWPAEQDLVHR